MKSDNLNKKQLAIVNCPAPAPASSPMLIVGDAMENLRITHDLGYSAIELHIRENENIDFDSYREMLDKYGMKISTLATGRMPVQTGATYTHKDPDKIKEAIEATYKYIELAKKLDTVVLLGWIRGPRPAEMSTDEYQDRLAEVMKPLAERAQKENVSFVIEGINRYEINTFNTGEQIKNFINKYKLPATYVLLDTFHMNIEESDPVRAISDCKDLLGHMHFADSNRHYPGDGHMDIEGILKALDDINYKGFLCVECLPLPENMTAAKKAKEYFDARLRG
jgi:sugar phosphate isomerase/epimerase